MSKFTREGDTVEREEGRGRGREERRQRGPFDLRGVLIPATLLAVMEKDLEYRE
jgi:hypothetical protein